MKRKSLCTFLAISIIFPLVFSGCGNSSGSEPAAQAETAESTDSTESTTDAQVDEAETESVPDETEPESAEDLASGTPWINSEVEGAITEDMQFDLKDDFAAAVNKDWYLETAIPEGYPFTGTKYDNLQATAEQVRSFITGDNEDNDPTIAQIQSLYELYMDWDSRNELGVTPLMPVLQKLEDLKSIDDLNAFLCLDGSGRGYLTGPVFFNVSLDPNNTSEYIVNLSSTELFLEDSGEYSELSDSGEMIQESKLQVVRGILGKAGYSDERIEEIIHNAMAFETAMASNISGSDEASANDAIGNSKTLTRTELEEFQGNIPIIDCILANGIDDQSFQKVSVTDYSYFDELKKVYTDENVPGMRDSMILRYVTKNADRLDEDCYEWNKEVLSATEGDDPTVPVTQSAISYVSQSLMWPISEAYYEHYGQSAEDKEIIYKLSEDILAEYKKMLQEEDFLSEETLSCACEKADNIIIYSLYPNDDEWPDYRGLTFRSKEEGGSLFDAATAIENFKRQREYANVGKSADRTKWPSTNIPIDANAQYNIFSNTFYIASAYAQGDTYNHDMSKEELYANVGTTIAHEISHAFDSSGALYDKIGTYSNWWTDEDKAEFNKRIQKMIDYYDTIVPWDGEKLVGRQVVNEACADIAGMKVILRLAKSDPDFDYDKFFRSYADSWKAKITESYEKFNIATNSHPLSYLRINVTLAQFDEFQKTYDIKEGDGMYVAPEDRISIW